MSAVGKPWLLLRSGAPYDYRTRDCVGMNFVLDVVVPLSRIARYLGHTDQVWSVAAHGVLASRIAEMDDQSVGVQLQCLHHDDAEALVGDCPTPVKRALAGEFEKLEEDAHYAIQAAARRAGYPYEMPESVVYKRFDVIALMAERAALKVPTPPERLWGYKLNNMDTFLMKKTIPLVLDVCRRGENWGGPAELSYLERLRTLEMKNAESYSA